MEPDDSPELPPDRPTRFTGGPITGQRRIRPDGTSEVVAPGTDGPIAPKRLSPAERIGWLVGLGAVVFAIIVYYGLRDQPWFALRFGDTAERQVAATRLADRGGKGVPELILLAGDPDADVRRAAIESLGVAVDFDTSAITPLIRALDDSSSSVRMAAVRGLSHASPDPRAADALIQALGRPDPQFREAIAIALRGFGEIASPAVASLLAMSAAHLRRVGTQGDVAAETLDVLGGAAVPGLVQATSHVNAAVRAEAMRRLERLSEKDPGAREAIAGRSASPFADVRAASTLSRAKSGGATPDVIARLALLLDRPDTHDQAAVGLRAAAAGLGLQGGAVATNAATVAEAAAIVPRLLSFGGEDDIDRRTATTLITSLGEAAMGALTAAITKSVEPERRRAIALIGRLAPLYPSSTALGPALDALSQDFQGDKDARLIGEALARFGPKALGPLMAGVGHRRRSVRAAAIAALRSLAPTREGTAALREALGGPRDSAEAAAEALASLGAQGAEMLAVTLASRDVGARRLAARSLEKVPAFPLSAHTLLLNAARAKDVAVRVAAVRALGTIRPRTEAISEALDRAGRDASSLVKRAASESRAGAE